MLLKKSRTFIFNLKRCRYFCDNKNYINNNYLNYVQVDNDIDDEKNNDKNNLKEKININNKNVSYNFQNVKQAPSSLSHKDNKHTEDQYPLSNRENKLKNCSNKTKNYMINEKLNISYDFDYRGIEKKNKHLNPRSNNKTTEECEKGIDTDRLQSDYKRGKEGETIKKKKKNIKNIESYYDYSNNNNDNNDIDNNDIDNNDIDNNDINNNNIDNNDNTEENNGSSLRNPHNLNISMNSNEVKKKKKSNNEEELTFKHEHAFDNTNDGNEEKVWTDTNTDFMANNQNDSNDNSQTKNRNNPNDDFLNMKKEEEGHNSNEHDCSENFSRKKNSEFLNQEETNNAFNTSNENSENWLENEEDIPNVFEVDENLSEEEKKEKLKLIKLITEKLAGPLKSNNENNPKGEVTAKGEGEPKNEGESIFADNRPIAIEVDGPSHFYANSNRYTTYTKLKHRILTKLGYNVIHISYIDWRKLRNKSEREEFILKKLKEKNDEFLDDNDRIYYNERMNMIKEDYMKYMKEKKEGSN
ncbi:RAP protein, putative [Plasmodium malariae]|uniref:RAP protein n=1 Tax=Plasmodium malariae TaxID=5858 RepID=A0A1A8WAR7_PLAMA|nr:RAP protein, putative [Plasmodium malariae]SBS88296.1 RAP protein [Plasmodium malariae]SCO93866.1 RAP protein, putative [Plasmodium malariae]